MSLHISAVADFTLHSFMHTGILYMTNTVHSQTFEDFKQSGLCDQQRLRPACPYAQSDQSLCWSLSYSMTVKLMSEQHFEFLSLTGGCAGSSQNATLLEILCCGSFSFTKRINMGVLVKQKTDQEADSQDMDLSLPDTRIK